MRTRPALSSAARPTSPLPALLFMMVRSRAPPVNQGVNQKGRLAAGPKPPIIIVAPSWIPAMASLNVDTLYQSSGRSSDVR